MAYAKRLTKEDLLKGGIVNITEDCKIFSKRGEISLQQAHKQGYITVTIYDCDSQGNKIKVPCVRTIKGKVYDTYVYKTRTVGLHRIMWAWFHGEVPEGYVVDHINNKHENLEDYRLSNLQLLTPKENVLKEREYGTRLLKCKLNKPRSYYEDKLKHYTSLYEDAKEMGDATRVHKLRTNMAQTRARLRYYDANKDQADRIAEFDEQEADRKRKWHDSVKDRKILEQYKQMFREAGNKDMWRQMIKVIKTWDTLEQIQKDHVFEVLHNFFSKYGRTL